MRMLVWTKTLLRAEDGAVTVEWMVLTAAVIGVGFVALGPIAFNTDSAIDSVAARINAVESSYMSD